MTTFYSLQKGIYGNLVAVTLVIIHDMDGSKIKGLHVYRNMGSHVTYPYLQYSGRY